MGREHELLGSKLRGELALVDTVGDFTSSNDSPRAEEEEQEKSAVPC